MVVSKYKLIILDIMFLDDSFIMKEISPDMLLNPFLFKQLFNDFINNI